MIKKILIANRGEISIRVSRTCREMGIRSVAIYSDADRSSMHVRYADEAYRVGPPPSAESYLNMDGIINVALHCKADAIHPGYGFLSENAKFAEKVKAAGLIFIGPEPSSIIAMGDKMRARELMTVAGVPIVPGSGELPASEEKIREIATKIGYPVMIKASAGGGGKGMRLVNGDDELIAAVKRAKSEALSSFGNDAVYLEKYLLEPHHIEFQIMADNHGNTVHLFERECSVQRRHQKVVEETPSPFLTDTLRHEMAKHAIAAAKSVNYSGAGTIEFLMDKFHNFYFLEMNTRLQVEHPVTEQVTGLDLVKTQILVAMNKELPFKQEDIVPRGHSIECRIYAEDPSNNFIPCPGIIKQNNEPGGIGVRVDGYLQEGQEIPLYYDPLISKLVTWAATRKEAIDRMKRALHEYKISGIKTNIPFLKKIMEVTPFVEGKYNTHLISENIDQLLDESDEHEGIEDIAMALSFIDHKSKQVTPENGIREKLKGVQSNWKNSGRILRPYRY